MEADRNLLRLLVEAQEDERKRLTIELHRDTARSLASLLVGLGQLAEAHSLDSARATALELRSQVVRTLEDVQRIAQGLHALAIGGGSFDEALRQFATSHDDRVSEQSSVRSRNAVSNKDAERLALLSVREREVLKRVAQGYTNREVSEELGLSVKSVEAYRARSMGKLGLRSRAEVVSYALSCGMLQASAASG